MNRPVRSQEASRCACLALSPAGQGRHEEQLFLFPGAFCCGEVASSLPGAACRGQRCPGVQARLQRQGGRLGASLSGLSRRGAGSRSHPALRSLALLLAGALCQYRKVNLSGDGLVMYWASWKRKVLSRRCRYSSVKQGVSREVWDR